VTATRFAEDASTLPFGVSVITAEQIRDAGVTTVNEALMKLLGIPGRLDFYGGGDYALDLRGFGGTSDTNQAVVVDGVRINEGDLGGTRLAGIPIDAIERIEVVRGSAGVLYGAGASAGAIVVTTKAAAGRSRTSSAYGHAGFGSNNLIDTRAGASLVGENLSLDVHGNVRATDGHRANFASNVEGLFVNAQWRNDWLRVGVRDSQDKLHTGLPGSLSAALYAADAYQTTKPNDNADIDNHSTHGYAEATLGNWSFGGDVGVRNKTLVSLSSGFGYAYDVEARNQNLHLRHSAPVGPVTNTLVAGIDREEWTRIVRGAFGATGNREAKEFYLTDDLAFSSGTRLNVGVRRSSFTTDTTDAPTSNVDERFTSWNVGVVQSIGSKLDAYVNAGRSVRFANVDEIGFVSPGVTLKPQVSRDLDAGVRLEWTNGRGQLRFYRNAIRDEIAYDPTAPSPFGGLGANANLPDTLHQGVELELGQALGHSVALRLNAALRRAEFSAGANDGKDIALTPHHTASLGVDWKPSSGHLLNAQLNTVGKQSPDFQNQCTMPAYTTLDLRYAFKLADAQLALGVTNVVDKKYYTQAFSCVGGVTNSIYPEAGRGVVASVRVAF
jgi:iron complex outermembrane receptor protein